MYDFGFDSGMRTMEGSVDVNGVLLLSQKAFLC